MTANAEIVAAAKADTCDLAEFILSKVSTNDRTAVAVAVRGVALGAIDNYLARGSLAQFFLDIGLSGDLSDG